MKQEKSLKAKASIKQSQSFEKAFNFASNRKQGFKNRGFPKGLKIF